MKCAWDRCHSKVGFVAIYDYRHREDDQQLCAMHAALSYEVSEEIVPIEQETGPKLCAPVVHKKRKRSSGRKLAV
jgi:hypothetical protein